MPTRMDRENSAAAAPAPGAARSKTAVFRADASPEIGSGHVMRCLALAQALSGLGWRTAFLTSPQSVEMVPALASGPHRLHLSSADPSARTAADIPGRATHDLLAVDHYDLDQAYETASRAWARRIVVIDDLADRRHDCDILVDPGTPDERPYGNLLPDGCRSLLGPAYAPLRADFWVMRQRVVPRAGDRRLRRILIGFGTGNRRDLVATALAAVAEAEVKADIDLVVGPGVAQSREVEQQISRMPQSVTVHQSVQDMTRLMAAADVAIGSAGVTAWERCALGLPSIVIVEAENQRRGAALMSSNEAAAVFASQEAPSAGDVARCLRLLAVNSKTRAEMSRRSAALSDGLGARRIAAILDLTVSAVGREQLWLRPVSPADGQALLDWQRDHETRRFARSPAIPDEEEHARWLAEKLADPSCVFHMIMHGEKPVCALRLDDIADDDGATPAFEVSLVVAPQLRRQGMGHAALSFARMLFPEAALHAEILRQNEASQALFRRAGYVPAAGNWHISRPPLVTEQTTFAESER